MKSRPPSSFARNIPGPTVAQSATGVVLAVGSGTVDVSMPGGEVHRRVPLAGGAPTVGARVTVTLLDGKPASAVGTRTMASAGGLVVLGSDTGGGGAGVYAPSPHALNSVHHTGTVADAQIPQLTTHAADPNAHHARAHAITSSSDHTVTGSTYQLVGLTGTNTLGLHTPASTVAANTIPIGGTGGAITWSGLQTLNAGATIATGQTLTTPAITAAANLTLDPAGDIIFNPTGNDLLPTTNYDLNLGAISKKYLTLHCAELWVETLVAQDTLATIGGRILVGPTTQLTSDLLAAGGAMYCKHNNLAIGDIVYMEAGGQLEFMRITAGPTGTGPYEYNMVRNLDGTGANNWYAGDALFNTGTTGDGFIDLYSLRGIKEASDYGPTIVGNVRNSNTFNDYTEHWAAGNLNGLYGYSDNLYGFAAGKFAASDSAWISIDSTYGLRLNNGTVTLSQWAMDGTILIGRTGASQDNVYIAAGALSIRNNTTERIGMTAAGVLTIKDSGGAAVITLDASAGAEITKKLTMPGANSAIAIGSTPPTSATAGTGIWIDRTGLYGLASNTRQAYISAADGKLYAGGGNTIIDVSAIHMVPSSESVGPGTYIEWDDGTDQYGSITTYTGAGYHTLNIQAVAVSGSTPKVSLMVGSSAIAVATATELSVPLGLNVGAATGAGTGEVIGTYSTDGIVQWEINNANTGSSASAALQLTSDVVTGRIAVYSDAASERLNITASGGYILFGTLTDLPIVFYQNNAEAARISSGSSLLIGTTTDTPNSGSMRTAKGMVTPEGGWAILATAAENLTAGEVVSVSTATSERVMKAAANSDMPCGAVYATATSGNPVWIVVSGFAEVTFKSGVTPTRGYIAYMSSTAGQADASSSLPSVEFHNREIGHVYKTGADGSTTTCILHFN